ncbi:hypothetical protein THRCLA_02623 [Thraustotheca clavata]|uniref:Prolyl 4-hydroxylase alpha subunit domain-containing protein n=1 Tax=Thraustotheca clavata TaxID=74557 RepID=A0A1W0A4P0_9STRA|nr:hypothetical protein THRCLA_02623 [Thraustotheca clavata]
MSVRQRTRAEPEPEAPTNKQSSKPQDVDSHGTNKLLLAFGSLTVLGVGYYLGTISSPQAVAPISPVAPQDVLSTASPVSWTLKASRILDENNELIPKYASDIVHIDVQQYLEPLVCTGEIPNVVKTTQVHVKDVMDIPAAERKSKNQVFLLLNGENQGIYVTWDGEEDCMHTLAKTAATALGADQDRLENGVKFMTQYGIPITTAAELEAAGRIAHVLLDFQIWMWPGIEKGYVYNVDGVTLTTVGMNPKVFSVKNFFTQEEADAIRDAGEPLLARSRITDRNKTRDVSTSRTSHTAFLNPSVLTRDFQIRSAKLARLPSPSYAEGLQLVRYAAGEFYRKHLDTFDSIDLIPKRYYDHNYEDYEAWVAWAAAKIDEFEAQGVEIPPAFRKGGSHYPVVDDEKVFPNTLLVDFHKEAVESNLFKSHYDEDWGDWIKTNLDNNATGIMENLLKSRGAYLNQIIKIWERQLNYQVVYSYPKRHRILGMTHLLYWIRWAKERISAQLSEVPSIAHPSGALYPKIHNDFFKELAQITLEDLSEDFLVHQMNQEWYDWVVINKDKGNTVQKVIRSFPMMTEVFIRAWENRVHCSKLKYVLPKYIKHFEPNRYVTLFMYLNDVEEGGETVFPMSNDRLVTDIEREGMDECNSGLAVPATGLGASLFYVLDADQVIDPMSRHGGCPPVQGVKWGSNSFMWNADAQEGASVWSEWKLN